VRGSTFVARGDPSEEILKAVAAQGADLVAMSTHGRGAIRRAIFGSVADRVSRASPVPVLLARFEKRARVSADIRRLVVPLDGSDLAEGALPVTVELARRSHVPVHLVQAVNLDATLGSMGGPGVPAVAASPEVNEDVAGDVQRAGEDYLKGVASRLEEQGVITTWAVHHGPPPAAIADACGTGDLIVLTSHGRGGVGRWLLGSVAEQLVREAPAPVVLVPAPDRDSGLENRATEISRAGSG
jgi:nucleotide-binding universal stress UspA family protein